MLICRTVHRDFDASNEVEKLVLHIFYTMHMKRWIVRSSKWAVPPGIKHKREMKKKNMKYFVECCNLRSMLSFHLHFQSSKNAIFVVAFCYRKGLNFSSTLCNVKCKLAEPIERRLQARDTVIRPKVLLASILLCKKKRALDVSFGDVEQK